VVLGDRLGLYRALAEAGPLTSAELADYTGTAERYVREWLPGQAAAGFVSYDPAMNQYSMSAAQALAFADRDGLGLPGAFEMVLGFLANRQRIQQAFRTGDGVAWGSHHQDVFTGCERFFRPGYVANLVEAWIPAIDGLDARLRGGIAVADIGCGPGSSTQILARTYRASTISGFDNHPRSVELAREMAAKAGVSDRCEFTVAAAQDFPGAGYGLVTSFDCLHDMGDPVAAARHVKEALADDGVWMIVEPLAGDRVEENLNPVGRLYYSCSTFLCVPHAISEGAEDALGNQAGPSRITSVIETAGFGRVEQVAQTPFNLVYAARP
jgi:SAM-dependent methyltransferase